MSSFLSKDDIELQAAFGKILSIENFSNYVNEITELIFLNQLDRASLDQILKEYRIKRIEDIKQEILELLLCYINIALNDNAISEREAANVSLLKRFFKVQEGDFFYYNKNEIQDSLNRQFEWMLADDRIDGTEALHKVGLQELFDLSYDQFLELNHKAEESALQRGADLADLDTAFKLPDFAAANGEVAGRAISQQVKDLVWNRDNGRCTECSSNAKLEFDHIIPFSKGGSNTYRNIQLLCEQCNRKKQNKIG